MYEARRGDAGGERDPAATRATVELVAGGADAGDAKRVICTLTDPTESAKAKETPTGAGDAHGK